MRVRWGRCFSVQEPPGTGEDTTADDQWSMVSEWMTVWVIWLAALSVASGRVVVW